MGDTTVYVRDRDITATERTRAEEYVPLSNVRNEGLRLA